MSSDCSKVTAGHLRRDAYLYVRQSTMYQVIHNTESTRRQYDPERPRGRAGLAAVPRSTSSTSTRDPPARPPLTGPGSSSWSGRCRWAGPGSCSGWNAPGWHATTPIGSS
jgi:hypothetical protein